MIKSLVNKIRNAPYAFAATMALAALESETASAQTSGNTVGVIANGITSQVGSVGKLAVGGAFLAGVGMVATGLMKLKAASESNGQVKYSEGLWRMAVGAGLVAVPAVTGSLVSSANLTGTSVNAYSGF